MHPMLLTDSLTVTEADLTAGRPSEIHLKSIRPPCAALKHCCNCALRCALHACPYLFKKISRFFFFFPVLIETIGFLLLCGYFFVMSGGGFGGCFWVVRYLVFAAGSLIAPAVVKQLGLKFCIVLQLTILTGYVAAAPFVVLLLLLPLRLLLLPPRAHTQGPIMAV